MHLRHLCLLLVAACDAAPKLASPPPTALVQTEDHPIDAEGDEGLSLLTAVTGVTGPTFNLCAPHGEADLLAFVSGPNTSEQDASFDPTWESEQPSWVSWSPLVPGKAFSVSSVVPVPRAGRRYTWSIDWKPFGYDSNPASGAAELSVLDANGDVLAKATDATSDETRGSLLDVEAPEGAVSFRIVLRSDDADSIAVWRAEWQESAAPSALVVQPVGFSTGMKTKAEPRSEDLCGSATAHFVNTTCDHPAGPFLPLDARAFAGKTLTVTYLAAARFAGSLPPQGALKIMRSELSFETIASVDFDKPGFASYPLTAKIPPDATRVDLYVLLPECMDVWLGPTVLSVSP